MTDPIEMPEGSARPAVSLEEACWLVWHSEPRSRVSAAMSDAQFVHFNRSVVAVQRNGRMEYFDEDGELGWTTNLPWPRSNLEMARLPGQPDFLEEESSERPNED